MLRANASPSTPPINTTHLSLSLCMCIYLSRPLFLLRPSVDCLPFQPLLFDRTSWGDRARLVHSAHHFSCSCSPAGITQLPRKVRPSGPRASFFSCCPPPLTPSLQKNCDALFEGALAYFPLKPFFLALSLYFSLNSLLPLQCIVSELLL